MEQTAAAAPHQAPPLKAGQPQQFTSTDTDPLKFYNTMNKYFLTHTLYGLVKAG